MGDLVKKKKTKKRPIKHKPSRKIFLHKYYHRQQPIEKLFIFLTPKPFFGGEILTAKLVGVEPATHLQPPSPLLRVTTYCFLRLL